MKRKEGKGICPEDVGKAGDVKIGRSQNVTGLCTKLRSLDFIMKRMGNHWRILVRGLSWTDVLSLLGSTKGGLETGIEGSQGLNNDKLVSKLLP